MHNEDVCYKNEMHGVFAIADGMGGHNAGEIAAKEAINFFAQGLQEVLEEAHDLCPYNLLLLSKNYILMSNQWLLFLAKQNKYYQQMGTTLSTILFYQESVITTHVGDSRIYRIREQQLEQMTEDHKKYETSIEREVLTQAIGVEHPLQLDAHISPAQENDRYLLCSDGVTSALPNHSIRHILIENHDRAYAVHKLISQAKANNSPDNISAMIVDVQTKDLY